MLVTTIFCSLQSAKTQTVCASASFLLWRGPMSIRGRRQPGWRRCRRRSRRRHCSRILDLVSGRSWKSPEAAAIAARLVRLLPQPGEAAPTAAAGMATAAPGNRKSPQSAEEFLVAVGCYGAGDVIHDAAPSGRARRARLPPHRNPAQHPNQRAAPKLRIPSVGPDSLAIRRGRLPFRTTLCIWGLCATRGYRSCRPICRPFRLPVVAKTITGVALEKKSRMTSW